MFIFRLSISIATVLLTGSAAASDAGLLTPLNFVGAGDRIAYMLEASSVSLPNLPGMPAPLLPSPFEPAMQEMRFTTPPEAPRSRVPCPGGGSVSTVTHDADRNGELSPGDRIETEFTACSINGLVLGGRYQFVVASHRFERLAEVTVLDFRFDRLGTSTVRWTGAARIELRTDDRTGAEHYRIDYRNLEVTQRGQLMRWNLSLDIRRSPLGAQSVGVDGVMTIAALRLLLQQVEPFALSAAGSPQGGRLNAIDRLGSRLEIEALSDRYRYRLWIVGRRNDSPDATSDPTDEAAPDETPDDEAAARR